MASTEKNTLEDNRIIYMSGDFNEEKAKEIVTKLFTLESKDPSKDILMYIDSYGGYVHSFLAIHDVMRMLRCDIATVAIGKTMSCGQMLLISGTKGKRFITPNARVLMHEIASGAFGKLSDMEVDINETRAVSKICEDLILKYTKIKKDALKDLMVRDSYFSAQEALKLGMVDHMIHKPKDLYSKINL
jgi:ATP-dependent Clp protease, protease subunit